MRAFALGMDQNWKVHEDSPMLICILFCCYENTAQMLYLVNWRMSLTLLGGSGEVYGFDSTDVQWMWCGASLDAWRAMLKVVAKCVVKM